MTTQTVTLAGWLLEQIAADEAVARGTRRVLVHGEGYSLLEFATSAEDDEAFDVTLFPHGQSALNERQVDSRGFSGGSRGLSGGRLHLVMSRDYFREGFTVPHETDADRFVIAQCAALRRVVELHAPWGLHPDTCQVCDEYGSPEPWPCPTLRALAQPYAGRPGWRDEWATPAP